jgi:hypothetical protein
MPEPFVRPELNPDDVLKIRKMASLISMSKTKPTLAALLTMFMAENMRLTKEVNIHREKLGYELLPVHEPKI